MSTASACPACGSSNPADAVSCAACGGPLPSRAKPFVVLPADGTTVRGPVGGPLTIKARAETTGGRFTFFENLVAPKEGPPLHRHGRDDGMWYILEGRFRFRADAETFFAPAGSFVFIPRGTAHCLQNIGDAPSRILVMFAPAGMERFFERHAALPPGPVDPDVYRAIAHDCSMEVVGPPLAESDAD